MIYLCRWRLSSGEHSFLMRGTLRSCFAKKLQEFLSEHEVLPPDLHYKHADLGLGRIEVCSSKSR